MKFLKYILLVAVIAFQACEDDVLDRAPLDKISEDNVWKDEVLMRAYITNLYSRLPHFAFDHGRWYNWTDEATTSTGNASSITQGSISKGSEDAGIAYWDYGYVRDINVFIEKVAAAPIPEASRKQMEGEARFIRAYVYFEMMKRYGGVPLVDIVIDPFAAIDAKYTSRATEEQVADFIDTELTTAASLLSDEAAPKAKVNKWTALALQARAMLWAASIARYGSVQLDGLVGIPADKADAYYAKASAAADAVITSGHYSLYDQIPDKAENYRHIFVDEENDEVIFEKAYDGINIAHSWDAWEGPNQWSVRGGSDDPTLDFILRYENIDGSTTQPLFGPDQLYDDGAAPFANKDPRLFGTVFFQADAWASGFVQTYEGIDPGAIPDPNAVIRNPNAAYENVPAAGLDSRSLTKDDFSTNSGFHIKKYVDGNNTQIPEGQSQNNWIVFRLAEMYLTQAEAEFELGNLQDAAFALNKTRERAGISLVDETTITLDKVRTERTSELAFEGGHRYWDLRRWRTAESVLNKRMQGLQIIFHYASGKYYFIPFNCEGFTRVFRPEHYYNPIVTSRIDNNPDLLQNPLY
jgi:hypothetical protein